MSSQVAWTPLGAGATALGMSRAGYPDDLVSRVSKLDLGPEHVFLAWELTRLASDLSDSDRRALATVVLALLVVQGEGGTRLSLDDEGGNLGRILDELELEDSESLDIVHLLDEARRLGTGGNVPSGLSAVLGPPGSYKPLILEHGFLYTQRLQVLEERVGRLLSDLLSSGYEEVGLDGSQDALLDVLDRCPVHDASPIRLTEEQQNAVQLAMDGRVAVISGRPGSGKTSIVASLLRVLARIGEPPIESMALAAPTGKAADRMRQSLSMQLSAIKRPNEADLRLMAACPPAATLHRLLGYSAGSDRFRHNEHNPLSERLVIVDECSMVDLDLMDRLLRAMHPEGRLVLLGDADQLPSVDTGAVLRDLCSAKATERARRAVVLRHSFRARADDPSGRAILSVAQSINDGDTEALLNCSESETSASKVPPCLVKRDRAVELQFEGAEMLEGSLEETEFFLERWLGRLEEGLPDLEERLSRAYVLAADGFGPEDTAALLVLLGHFERFRILCATRMPLDGTGSEAVNRWFHRRRLRSLGVGSTKDGPRFLVGEPVLVTRNDHLRRLYNGDSGLIVWVSRDGEDERSKSSPVAVFPRGDALAAFSLESLRGKLEPAWATTVHKAQGSEYDHVAVMLPTIDVRPLTRELLYTAVTRAKRSVTILGSRKRLVAGTSRRMDRASGLSARLS